MWGNAVRSAIDLRAVASCWKSNSQVRFVGRVQLCVYLCGRSDQERCTHPGTSDRCTNQLRDRTSHSKQVARSASRENKLEGPRGSHRTIAGTEATCAAPTTSNVRSFTCPPAGGAVHGGWQQPPLPPPLPPPPAPADTAAAAAPGVGSSNAPTHREIEDCLRQYLLGSVARIHTERKARLMCRGRCRSEDGGRMSIGVQGKLLCCA